MPLPGLLSLTLASGTYVLGNEEIMLIGHPRQVIG